MTISSATNRNNYTGTGSTDTYSYTFKIIADTDLLVTQRDTNDVETTLVLTTDYTVTGAGDASGGTIVLVAGNLPTGYVLSIRRVRPLTQGTDIRNQGDFFPEVHEDAFDHLVMLAQQLQDQIDRATLLPETSPSSVSAALPLAEPLKLVRWNAAGTALENITLASLGSVVSVSRGLSLTANDLAMLDLIPFLKGADVASADTLILGSDGNYFDITGTTGITAINTVAVGALIILQFDDALTITHHATNLRLQGETDITTAAGDHAIFVEYATGQWRMLAYSRSASAPAISNQVGVSDTQTLTNKTLTSPTLTSPTLASPTLNTSLSGSAFLDEDNMASDAADKAASQQSIKAYVDARTVTNGNFHDHNGGDGAQIPQGGFANYAAGDVIVIANDLESSTTSTTYVKLKENRIARNGTLRISFDLKSDVSGNAYGRVYKNGSPIGTERSGSVVWTTFTEDFSGLVIGDLIQLYLKTPSADTAYCRNYRIKSNAYVERNLEVLL